MNLRCAFIDKVNSSLGHTGHIARDDRLFTKKLGLIKKFSNGKKYYSQWRTKVL